MKKEYIKPLVVSYTIKSRNILAGSGESTGSGYTQEQDSKQSNIWEYFDNGSDEEN